MAETNPINFFISFSHIAELCCHGWLWGHPAGADIGQGPTWQNAPLPTAARLDSGYLPSLVQSPGRGGTWVPGGDGPHLARNPVHLWVAGKDRQAKSKLKPEKRYEGDGVELWAPTKVAAKRTEERLLPSLLRRGERAIKEGRWDGVRFWVLFFQDTENLHGVMASVSD